MTVKVLPLDRDRIAARRIHKARARGRCGATHPDFPDVPCQRPLGHGSRYAHGSKGWGNGVEGVLYWYDGDRKPRFRVDWKEAGGSGRDD